MTAGTGSSRELREALIAAWDNPPALPMTSAEWADHLLALPEMRALIGLRERVEEPIRRPYWLPEEVWLGVEVGRWPIQAFSMQDMATRWAAEGKQDTPIQAGDRRRIFRVSIPADVEAFEAEHVPATTRLKAATS